MVDSRDMYRIDYDRESDVMSIEGSDISAFVALPCGRVAYVNTRDMGRYIAVAVRGRLQVAKFDGE